MKFYETDLKGEYLIYPEKITDLRGHFFRAYCEREFSENELNIKWVQNNVFFSKKKGTLRGLAFQKKPHEEVRLIRCTRGKIFDVAVDLRSGSSTFGKYTSVILSAATGIQHYIPKGFAHGYSTLSDNTEVLYQVSEFYHSEAGGIKWDDPIIAISWPMKPIMISEKDKGLPYLNK